VLVYKHPGPHCQRSQYRFERLVQALSGVTAVCGRLPGKQQVMMGQRSLPRKGRVVTGAVQPAAPWMWVVSTASVRGIAGRMGVSRLAIIGAAAQSNGHFAMIWRPSGEFECPIIVS
jgi:hypothetical protein